MRDRIAGQVGVACGAAVLLACTVVAAESTSEAKPVGAKPIGMVKQVEGSAMLSQGADYVDAVSGMKFYDLDRVMVLEDSTAALELTDGCVYEVEASQMLTVKAGDTCETLAERANMAQLERDATSQLGRSTAAAAAPGSGGAFFVGADPGLGILAGLSGVGMIASLANGTGSDDRKPLSPLSPQ